MSLIRGYLFFTESTERSADSKSCLSDCLSDCTTQIPLKGSLGFLETGWSSKILKIRNKVRKLVQLNMREAKLLLLKP